MADKTTLAERIRELRKARSWSQDRLAAASGLSLRTIQRIERGSPGSPETVQSIALALDEDVDELARLYRSERRKRASRRYLLPPGKAAILGVALCLPSISFVLANIGFYEFEMLWLEPLMPRNLAGLVWSSPALLLGLPAVVVLINAQHLVWVALRKTDDGTAIESVELVWRWPQALLVTAAIACISILLIYALLENLSHYVEAAVGGQQIQDVDLH